MAKIQDIDIPYLEFAEAAAPGTPASGIVRIYSKADGLMYSKDDAGTESSMAATGGVVPWALMPYYGNAVSELITVGSANRALYIPCVLTGAATITGVKVYIGTSSGNLCVGLYDSSGTRVATSGAVASPGITFRTINFTAAYSAAAGRYYLALSADNVTVTFAGTSNSVGGVAATVKYQDTAHPLPTSITSAGESGRAIALVGVITGGFPA